MSNEPEDSSWGNTSFIYCFWLLLQVTVMSVVDQNNDILAHGIYLETLRIVLQFGVHTEEIFPL